MNFWQIIRSNVRMRCSLSHYDFIPFSFKFNLPVHPENLIASTAGVAHLDGNSSHAASKGQAVRQAERAHAEFARIAAELKELELYVAEIEETVNQTSTDIDGEANHADDVEQELEKASGKKQVI